MVDPLGGERIKSALFWEELALVIDRAGRSIDSDHDPGLEPVDADFGLVD
jgi:hypothetical protein